MYAVEAVEKQSSDWRDEHGVRGWSVAHARNAVAVDLKELKEGSKQEVRDLVDPVRARFRDAPESIDDVPDSQLACHLLYRVCNPLRGGTVLHELQNSRDVPSCTLGFNATSGHARFVLTAGHCSDGSATYYHDDSLVGSTDDWHNEGNADVQRLGVEQFDWDQSRWVIHDTSSSTSHAYQIHSVRSGTLSEGQRVCVTGAATARDEGWSDATLCPLVSDGRYDACLTGGDSGAPVYAGNEAIGLHKARFSACDAIASYATNAEQHMNVDIVTD